jgi:hypothetical protein
MHRELEQENLKGRYHLEDRRTYIVLNCSERNRERWCGLQSSGFGLGPVAGSCEYDNEPSSHTNDREFLM